MLHSEPEAGIWQKNLLLAFRQVYRVSVDWSNPCKTDRMTAFASQLQLHADELHLNFS